MYLKYAHKHKTTRCVCVCMSVYLHTSMCKRFSRRSYIIMHSHLMHGCTDFGQKKQLSAPLPPPPQLLSNFVFLGMSALLMIRYVVYYSCLLIEKSLRVTSSSSSLPRSPSSSLPFWSHDVVSLSESGCVVQSQICHWSETEKKKIIVLKVHLPGNYSAHIKKVIISLCRTWLMAVICFS